MTTQFGYKTITVTQLANLLWALQTKELGYREFRLFMALQEMVATREAAQRVRARQGERTKRPVCYGLHELAQTTALPLHIVGRGMKRMEGLGLLSFQAQNIHFATQSIPGSEELAATLAGPRSAMRPIPVPRSVLTFLATNEIPALGKVVVAYLVRGLSICRRTGEISCAGTVKAGWIAEVLGLSHRTVKYAQADLRRRGWITKDTGSYQRKLNRDGAYFVINVALSLKISAGDGIVKRSKQRVSVAPLLATELPQIAPPNKDKRTSYESKNQRTPLRASSGVCAERNRSPNLPPPTLSNIRREDFFQFDRSEALYFQAVGRRWIPASEAMALNFLSAVVRAREVGKDPVRLLVAMVRKGLWHHITQAQEDRARAALIKFREQDPGRFSMGREGGVEPRRALRTRRERRDPGINARAREPSQRRKTEFR